ncbi:DUF2452 domain-containing protein [Flavobacterium sp.]|uniref:DUF2452 domain-containing protein n=1 Tax=Flavobacterium sp. TaxID=239 RepID=UPI00286C0392|nr:DUF2452 domain-containing protein [Flavobacterium sp.]
MEKEKPDNVVYSKEKGFYASVLPYSTNVGAPVIKIDDVVAWKSRGIHNVNKEFENKFNELKMQYQNLMQEYEWNELVYNAKFSFEPVIGEIYHLYIGDDGINFLSLIAPHEWNKEHIATFKLNSDKKWIVQDEKANSFFSNQKPFQTINTD